MHESEASFQAIVDPYARADFLSLVRARKAWTLEEGFITFQQPSRRPFSLRVGKMRAAFGQV
jgi:hypothetical protein